MRRESDGSRQLLLDKSVHGAEASALNAADAAGRANAQAREASALATDARREAEKFAQDITSAKEPAADAVSRLADAEHRLADATKRELQAEEELRRLRTPRSLTHIDDIVASLRGLGGTEYRLAVFPDEESIQF